MRELWERADFNPIAARNVLTGELLASAADVHTGERVLDVAAGTGNTALAAARRGARVAASDFAPALLKTAARRAEVESLGLTIEYGDAQDLPFDDDSFDVVLSSFGAMYAPDQERTASELTRVCRPGGRIAMANWTPDGVVAKVQAAMTVDPAPGPSSLTWGTEEGCRTRVRAGEPGRRRHPDRSGRVPRVGGGGRVSATATE
jgi:SAM-dependent methyltransferase